MPESRNRQPAAMDYAFRVLRRSLNDLFQAIGSLIFVNLLWIALTLPLITAPAAMAGLYYYIDLTVRGEEPPLSSFFTGFRRYFVRSWALVALNLAMLIVLLINLVFYLNQVNELIRIIAIPIFYLFLFWCSIQTYLFPLMLAADREEKNELNPLPLFKKAARLTLAEPAYSAFIGLALLAWLVISIALAGPVLILTTSGMALIRTRATLAILGREPEQLKPGWK